MDPLEPTTIGLPAELKKRLEQAAAQAGTPVDDMIRAVLEQAIKHEPLHASGDPHFEDQLGDPELTEIIDRMYPGSGWG